MKRLIREMNIYYILISEIKRFGSKACRVFRLLIEKRHLEQKQVSYFLNGIFSLPQVVFYPIFSDVKP